MKPYYLQQFLESIISLKFLVFVISCLFLCASKISSDNWVMVALGVAGLHTANTMTSIFKGCPPVIPRQHTGTVLPRGSQIDNPDGA